MKILSFILFLTIGYGCYSQPCYHDNFNDTTLSYFWRNNSRTIKLSEHRGVLEISVNRPDTGYTWDQFHIRFNDFGTGIDISESPAIQFKLKSDIPFLLTLYAVFHEKDSDTNVNWLQYHIPGNNTWDDYYFTFSGEVLSDLDILYFYINGGISKSIMGTINIDDMEIGTNRLNYTMLNHSIKAAINFYNNSSEGIDVGTLKNGSKEYFLKTINTIKEESRKVNVTQSEIDTLTERTFEANSEFEKQVNKPALEFYPVNHAATLETMYLYNNLKKSMGRYIFFGQQDPTGYGVGWSNDDDRSDANSVCGHYPALGAWELSGVAEGEPADRLRYRIEKIYGMGGFNTVCWHQFDPLNRGFYAKKVNNDSIVKELLPGGKYHEIYVQKLDRIARFFHTLKGPKGESIPIIFRPYHEHNGNWFWWGSPYCTEEEFISLWQFTYHYLTDVKKVNNLIWAYSPDIFVDSAAYLERYPGDEFVDIMGHDNYGSVKSIDTRGEFLECLNVIVTLANERNKVAALTETGLEGVKINNWYTDILLNPIKSDSIARQIAYVALWRNATVNHHYGPYPNHPANSDFMLFYKDPAILFMDDFNPVLYNSNSLIDSVIK